MSFGRATASLIGLASTLVFASAFGCRASHVVVTVVDPENLAGGADTVAIGFQRGAVDQLRSIGDGEFPLTFSLEYHQVVDLELWVEARAGAAVVARGSITAALNQGDRVEVRLGRACARSEDCSDGIYCNGEEACFNGVCEAGREPCPALASGCTSNRCDESLRYCELVSEVGLDDFNPCTIDGCDEHGEPIHLGMQEGAPCAGQLGNCVAGICRLQCGDGLLDPRVEECDPGMDTPACFQCKVRLRKLSHGRAGPAAISGDGSIVALGDGERVLRLNWRTAESEVIVDGEEALRISMSRDARKLTAAVRYGPEIWSADLPISVPASLHPYSEVVVSDDGEHVLVSSSERAALALVKIFDSTFDAWLVDLAFGEIHAQVSKGRVAYRGYFCSPCLHLGPNDDRMIATEGDSWSFSGDDLFVAQAGRVVRYEGPDFTSSQVIAGTEGAREVSVSENGMRLVFATEYPISAGDFNGYSDIYALELDPGAGSRPARRLAAVAGLEPNGRSFAPMISADGEWVVFTSDASNLELEGTDAQPSILLSRFHADL